MTAPPLISSYTAPAVRRGDRVHCHYRDADCVVTGMHNGPLPWPRCRALESRGGSGLLVTDELVRAIRTESAAAIMHWFGVGQKAVWRWRAAFLDGLGKFRTEGSRAAHVKASRAGGEVLKAKEWTDAECDAKSVTAKRIGNRPPARWTAANGGWTAAEEKLLGGKSTDAEVAAKTGRSVDAVRSKRRRMR